MTEKTFKKIAPNTYRVIYQDGTKAIRLYSTDIIAISETSMPDGKPVVVRRYDIGKWKTATTRKRLNDFGDLRIWQEKGNWFCRDASGQESYFYNGIYTINGRLEDYKPIIKRPIYTRDRIPEARQMSFAETPAFILGE